MSNFQARGCNATGSVQLYPNGCDPNRGPIICKEYAK